MQLSQQDIKDLLEILNIALYDTKDMIRRSHDAEEVAAYKDQQKRLREWIHRFSQNVKPEDKESKQP